MIGHVIPMLDIYDRLNKMLIEASVNLFWKLLWCIGTCEYFFLMVLVDTKVDSSVFIYLFTICLILHTSQGKKLFKTMELKTFLRFLTHILLTIYYWPFMLYIDVSEVFSFWIYIMICMLEYMGDKCVIFDDNFINQKNDGGKFLVHVISVYILNSTCMVFGSDESNEFLLCLFYYVFHFNIFQEMCKKLIDLIKIFINWYQNKYCFFKRYSYCKWILYFIIQCTRVCSYISAAFLYVYLYTSLVSQNNNGIQIINVTNLDENMTMETRFSSERNDTYSITRKFTLHESIKKGRKFLQQKIIDIKCEELKYFHGEYVILEFLYLNHTDRKSYFWIHNDKLIEVNTDGNKQRASNDTYGDAVRFELSIFDLGTDDFGKYTLFEEYTLTRKDLCSYFYDISFHSNILKTIGKGVIVREYLKSFCIIPEKPTLITVFSELGHRLVLSHFRFHALNVSYVPRYTIDDDKDIKSVCTNYSCDPSISNIMSFKEESIAHHSAGLTLVNISFCVCPQAFSRNYHTLKFVNRNSNSSAISPVKIDLRPTMNVLNNHALFNDFHDCQLLGYVYIEDFFLCIQRSSEKLKKFQTAILNSFKVQSYIDAIGVVVAFVLPIMLGKFSNKCLRKLLRVIFHPDLYIRHSRECQQASGEFDVYISYCDESEHDRTLATETITGFVGEELGYSTNSTNDIPAGAHRRLTFENLITRSKALIIILSKEYLENDVCIQEYEYTLLPLLGMSSLSKDNILILKTDDCPHNVAPLKTFTVLDWSVIVTNIRTEKEKKQELKLWLEKRYKQKSSSNIIKRICRLIRQFFADI